MPIVDCRITNDSPVLDLSEIVEQLVSIEPNLKIDRSDKLKSKVLRNIQLAEQMRNEERLSFYQVMASDLRLWLSNGPSWSINGGCIVNGTLQPRFIYLEMQTNTSKGVLESLLRLLNNAPGAVVNVIESTNSVDSEPHHTQSDSATKNYEELYRKGTMLLHQVIIDSPSIVRDDVLQGIEYLEQAIELEPKSWPACWVLGRAYTATGELTLANRMFERSFQLNPDDNNVGRELGLSFLRLGFSQFAVLVFSKLVSQYPEDHTFLANLGLCHWMAGNAKLGLDCVDRALRLNKNEISLKLRKGIVETLDYGIPPPSRLED
jgi:tetratricopeptide (TPR) repeat protein